METFALFGDQTASRIDSDFCSPSENPVHVILIPVHTDLEVKASAEISSYASYHILRGRNVIGDGERFCLTYYLADQLSTANVIGKSAGLAFAVKFALEVYQNQTQTTLPGAIAATGIISSSNQQAQVLQVEAIDQKIQGALAQLNAGDRILYPKSNEPHLDDNLYRLANEKEIRLIPVETLKDALEELLPSTQSIPAIPPASLVKILVGILLLVGVFVGVLYFPNHNVNGNPSSWVEKIKAQLNQGNTMSAQEMLARALITYPNFKVDFLKLQGDLTTPLEMDVKVHLYREKVGYKGDITDHASQMMEKGPVRSGDAVQLELTPHDQCFVYAFLVDARDTVFPLFPNATMFLDNPLSPNQRYLIPPDDKGFILDNAPGQEILYVVASRWPGKDLEELIANIHSRNEKSKPQLVEHLRTRLSQREIAQSKGLAGVLFSQYTIRPPKN